MSTATANAAISSRGLGKAFGATQALTGVDLDIRRGEICALLGQNGAGKTTFIRCALGLTRPSAGALSVLGEPAGSPRARHALGVMMQASDLPDLLTAREHLALFASYFDDPYDIDALMRDAEIEDFAEKRYKALSGGQKRRVQFALALVGRPDVLFLDEPTTGLDQDARRAVWANVRRLAGEGRTVLLTTHYLEEADALADRIVVLSEGRVIADGTADEIRARVGGALIVCQTILGEADAGGLPSVRSAEKAGRMLRLLSDDAAKTLAALLARDPDVSDLTVKKPSLEEAFAALTNHTEVGS